MIAARQSTTVGIVGLGAMGRPIAGFIAEAGFDIVAYDHAPGEPPRGVRPAANLAEVAEAEVVIVLVPTDDDVIGVIGGEDGLIAHGHEGQIIVISASVRPATCHRLAQQGADAGIHVIDAALIGGARGAETGKLALLIGGDAAVAERASAVFLSFATGFHVLGEVGSGQIAKSANNLIHWAQIVAIDEALRLAQRLGLQPAALRLALQDGPADSRALREIEDMRFTWYIKDIAVAEQLAEDAGMELPVAQVSRRLMDGITVQTVKELLA
jgi:3-hydroxyisobutyrate dehydrogenase-like beta-hydroxyacid dehydrogenase